VITTANVAVEEEPAKFSRFNSFDANVL